VVLRTPFSPIKALVARHRVEACRAASVCTPRLRATGIALGWSREPVACMVSALHGLWRSAQARGINTERAGLLHWWRCSWGIGRCRRHRRSKFNFFAVPQRVPLTNISSSTDRRGLLRGLHREQFKTAAPG